MTWTARHSRIALGVWAVAAVVADVFLATNARRGDTWSEVLRSWGRAQAFVPYCLAAIGGHLWSPWAGSPVPWSYGHRFVFVLGVGIVLALASALVRRRSGRNPIPPWLATGTGFVIGAAFWI